MSHKGESPGLVIHEDGSWRFQNRLCIPNKVELKRKILEEAHNTRYSLYRDLRQFFWWDTMKGEIAEYVDKCLTCQVMKVEPQCPVGELRPLEIPIWK